MTDSVVAHAVTHEDSLLAAALAYGAAGFPVIPLHTPDAAGKCSCHADACEKGVGKHPRTMHGLSDASQDELAIRRWWKTWPDANIGLVVPHGYAAVDIDGEGGVESLKAAGYDFPRTATARTGRGWHYLYRTHVTIPPKVGFLNHVDLRGPGSYIVAAPSKHQSGRTYTWVHPLDAVADAPEWLTARSPQTEGGLRERFDTAAALEGVALGDRDNALFRLAAKLRYADVPHELALGLVLEAAAKCVPPFPERDARAKVDSAYGRYSPTVFVGSNGFRVEVVAADAVTVTATSPKGEVEIAFTEMEMQSHSLDADMRVRLLMPGQDAEPYIQRLNLLSMSSRETCRRELDSVFGKDVGWSGILSRAIAKSSEAFRSADRSVLAAAIASPLVLEFVVDTMIPDDGVTILFGSGSSGKTYVALHMAVCIAMGLPWLGRPSQRRNVLWIDHETGAATFGYRLGRVCAALGIPRESVTNLFYWAGDGVSLPDSVPGLQRTIQQHNIGMVFLDHAALACGGEPEKSDSALRFYRASGKLRLPMLVIAHITGEGERDPAQVHKPYGSVFWSNGARRTWFIQRQQEQEAAVASIGLFCRKVNDGTKPRDFGLNLFFQEDGGPVHVLPADIRQTPKLQQTRGLEYQIWEVLGDGEPMTYLQIAEAIGAKVQAVRKAIERHPRMFNRDNPSAGGAGNVVHWSRSASEWDNRDTGTTPIEKKSLSGFGEASHPSPGTQPGHRDMDNRDKESLSRLSADGDGPDATTPALCRGCTRPLLEDDSCPACSGWN